MSLNKLVFKPISTSSISESGLTNLLCPFSSFAEILGKINPGS